MLTEFRQYRIRPGHIADMHARMNDVLLPMFAEFGVPRPRAIWDSHEFRELVVLLFQWESYEARLTTLGRFGPAWRKKKDSLGTEIVMRTEVSFIAPWLAAPTDFTHGPNLCESAWSVQTCVAANNALSVECVENDFALFRGVGATSIMGFEFTTGLLPQSLLIASWPDIAQRQQGLDRLARSQSNADSVHKQRRASIIEAEQMIPLNRAVYLNW